MGGNGSTTRKVSFGLDEKVTVIEGVKLSEDVLLRMESQTSDSNKLPQQDSYKPPPSLKPTGPSTTEIHKEMHKSFEHQRTLVQEELARLAQQEKAAGLDELPPTLITDKTKLCDMQKKTNLLARELERKEKELTDICAFYKKQLEILEKKNLDSYKQSVEQYNQTPAKAEAHIRSRETTPVCTELQAKVLQCYRENPQQTLLCSSLAKQYMTCVQQAKKSSLTNHG
ncbi:MICOS complex subunit mic25a-like [Thalassophryne amazonica]|uniref:MICOS complex subunit mic25a-like n=1 Tax=Thalassophryne amazonica TaxID=390379 RepID=UPI001471267B|nr:MICOS complex subunit mic25a-like [Thalassophryne amazonica]